MKISRYLRKYSSSIEYRNYDQVSKIFCEGELLHDVQMARIYPDSKTFVDKKLLFPEPEVISKYQKLKNDTGTPSVQQLKKFIDDNFEDDHIDVWLPPDFKDEPSIVNNIEDEVFKRWIIDINKIWKQLGMKVSDDVKLNPELHSMLYMPNGFIKAGGRFREMYYWDSYWILRGLLLSDMVDTARGIVENIIWLVKLYGHMPNGSRKYYLQRSQPPLLIQMAATYHSWTKDDNFIKTNIKYLDNEFQWWYQNRMVDVIKDGKTYKMARYNASSCTPRPESYYEDYVLSMNLSTSNEKKRLFTGIKSAAESGWDFSSRHIRGPDDTNQGSLLDMDTPNIIFVDLNCILHANAVVLSEWYRYFGNEVRSQYYKNIANKLFNAIENVLWNEEVGMWLDWDRQLQKSRNYFYASNLTPLWTGSYSKKSSYVDKAIIYLLTQGIIKFDFSPVYYGVPTSKENTTQQWDYPNCWAPLQAIVIQGLERTKHPIARYVAFKMAQNWVKTLYTGFSLHGFMYEKYSAIELGVTGAGGEYNPQTGFGWTNGFLMEIFNTWGKFLKANEIVS
ncbi:trehalase-like isoform X2 [Planococcus citri]|uniref:trehalase-like isoform X2 n=1 Tax=Planococcus citri TaxID=170843 RepID=UPI0031F7BB1A